MSDENPSTTSSGSAPFGVLLADDHAMVREGLTGIVGTQPDMRIVGTAATGPEAIEAFRKLRPDVLVLDLRLPGMDGLEVLAALKNEFPASRVLVLSSHDGDEAIFRAIRAGAGGYVLKTAPARVLLDAIRAVHQGRRFLSREASERLAGRVAEGVLSERELDIVRGIAQGLGNREIGASLGISESTVKNHINNILSKLDASDRTHAVMIALQRGMIDL